MIQLDILNLFIRVKMSSSLLWLQIQEENFSDYKNNKISKKESLGNFQSNKNISNSTTTF